MSDTTLYQDEVFRRLHEVATAALEVPAEHQPRRLQDALASLVAIGISSTGTTYLDPFADSGGQAGIELSS
jgi:hypothetical protein